MDQSTAFSRRTFVRGGVAAATLAPLVGPAAALQAAPQGAEGHGGDPWLGLKMGIASYTFSRLPLEPTIQGIRRVGLHYVSIKEAHLPLKSTTEERKRVAKLFRDAGITPLSCGNIRITDDEAETRNTFEYARDAGIPTIVCSPSRSSLSLLDQMVREFDIKIAIHNHGPEDKVWPSPYDAWEAVEKHDERLGLCIDVGHTRRAGVDPVEAIRKCSARLYDLHIKDISSPSGVSRPVELGRGVLDLHGILRALLDIKFPYHVGLEYEKDMQDPLPGVAESIGFLHGVLSEMGRA